METPFSDFFNFSSDFSCDQFQHRPTRRVFFSEDRSRSTRTTPYAGARAFRDSECKCGRIRALYFSHVAIQSNVGMRGESADTKTPGYTRSYPPTFLPSYVPLPPFLDPFPSRRTNRETIVVAGNFLAEESKGEFETGRKKKRAEENGVFKGAKISRSAIALLALSPYSSPLLEPAGRGGRRRGESLRFNTREKLS